MKHLLNYLKAAFKDPYSPEDRRRMEAIKAIAGSISGAHPLLWNLAYR